MRAIRLCAMVVLGAGLTGCGGGVGACLGLNGIGGHDYCYNDWDQSDCDEHEANEVNDATWTFYAGETCEELGYPEN